MPTAQGARLLSRFNSRPPDRLKTILSRKNYALGLAQLGYRDSPLETMAYDLQAEFEQGKPTFQVKPLVLQKFQQLFD